MISERARAAMISERARAATQTTQLPLPRRACSTLNVAAPWQAEPYGFMKGVGAEVLSSGTEKPQQPAPSKPSGRRSGRGWASSQERSASEFRHFGPRRRTGPSRNSAGPRSCSTQQMHSWRCPRLKEAGELLASHSCANAPSGPGSSAGPPSLPADAWQTNAVACALSPGA